MVFAEAEWRPDDQWRLGIEVRHTSRLWANDANDAYAPAANIWALRAGWRTTWGSAEQLWRWDVLARIENLTDKLYAGSVIVNEGNRRFFEVGAGRAWSVSSSVSRSF